MKHFQKETGRAVRGISREAENMLSQRDWPGNVRELQNVIEAAVVMGSSDVIVPEDLPDQFFERAIEGAALPDYHEALNKTKRDLLERAFARAQGDLKQAAALLGVSSSYVYRLLENLNLKHLLA